MIETDEELAVRDAWGALRAEFVDSVVAALALEDSKPVRTLTKNLRSADMADILEILDQPQREAPLSRGQASPPPSRSPPASRAKVGTTFAIE